MPELNFPTRMPERASSSVSSTPESVDECVAAIPDLSFCPARRFKTESSISGVDPGAAELRLTLAAGSKRGLG